MHFCIPIQVFALNFGLQSEQFEQVYYAPTTACPIELITITLGKSMCACLTQPPLQMDIIRVADVPLETLLNVWIDRKKQLPGTLQRQ